MFASAAMCVGASTINLIVKKMKFRELFWAHLTHRKLRSVHAMVLCCPLLLISIDFLGQSEFRPVKFFGALGFMLAACYQQPLFCAFARIPADIENKVEAFYRASSWLVYILQMVSYLVLFTAFLYLMNISYWSLVPIVFVPIFFLKIVRRYLRLRASPFSKYGGGPPSHFRGHEHHSSKTIR